METEHLRDDTKMVGGGSFPRPWRVEKNDKNGMRNIVVAANGRLVAELLPIDGATVEDCEAAAEEIASASSGNAAEMRVALEAVKVAFDSGTIGPVGNYPPARLVAKTGIVMEKVEKALAAPARNCDVGTAEEQTRRIRANCEKYKPSCKGCKFLTDIRHENCWLKWAQMSYKEGDAKKNENVI